METRVHTWTFFLEEDKDTIVPAILKKAFPDAPITLTFQSVDPMNDVQFSLMDQATLTAHGIDSFSCSTEQVREPGDIAAKKQHTYRFVLKGSITVAEDDGEDVAFGWTETTLQEFHLLNLPWPMAEMVTAFQVDRVDLSLQRTDNNA